MSKKNIMHIPHPYLQGTHRWEESGVQRTLTKKLTNIYIIALLQIVGMQMLWWALNTSIQHCVKYLGAYLMCIDNKHLTDKVPRGNGTLCWVLDFKLKHNAPSYKYKSYYGRKVRTVNATDADWVECEHVNKTGLISYTQTIGINTIHGKRPRVLMVP